MKYFEIKVINCTECPNKGEYQECDLAPFKKWEEVYEENKDQLTPSCPMWQETKEQV